MIFRYVIDINMNRSKCRLALRHAILNKIQCDFTAFRYQLIENISTTVDGKLSLVNQKESQRINIYGIDREIRIVDLNKTLNQRNLSNRLSIHKIVTNMIKSRTCVGLINRIFTQKSNKAFTRIYLTSFLAGALPICSSIKATRLSRSRPPRCFSLVSKLLKNFKVGYPVTSWAEMQ